MENTCKRHNKTSKDVALSSVFGAGKDEPSAKRANLHVRELTILSEGKWDRKGNDPSPIRPMPKRFRVAG